MTTSYLYDYVTRHFYAKLTKWIWPEWVHPNVITLLGAFLALLSGLAIRHGSLGWASLLFTCYYLCDCMDGEHARRTNQCSQFGAWLDHVVDGTVANYAGYTTIATVLLGISQDDDIYKSGIQAWSCLWLAPHVVCHFNGGSLVYGTKLVGIEEAYLLVILILAAGWWGLGNHENQESSPLLSVPVVYMETLIQALTYLSISYVGVSVANYLSSHNAECQKVSGRSISNPSKTKGIHRKYAILFSYIAFQALGKTLVLSSSTVSGLVLWWACWTGLIGVTIWQP